MNNFAKKIRKGEKTILYELLPPPKNLSKLDLHKSLELFAEMTEALPIDGVNLPEVREEVRNGMRNSSELVKLEPVIVASYLERFGINNIVINKPIVHETWDKQLEWLKDAYGIGVKNFVFVGGESSSIRYPGKSVTEAAKIVSTELSETFPDICIGGISIPSRTNEAKRLVEKTLSGIEFFTTQVLYEASSTKQLLRSYWDLCRLREIEPQTIFLSFAPIATYRDAELLTWLGVEIPQVILKELKTGWLGMAERSLKICEQNLSDILSYIEEQEIHVPLGINIEHINRHNFELSFTLLERLSRLYLYNHKSERPYIHV